MNPKYTKREKHLLYVIACLRGNASDAWSRLNCIVTRRRPDLSLETAIEEHAQKDELLEGEAELRTPLLGAGLPWNKPHLLPLDVAQEQEATLDKRSHWSEEKLLQKSSSIKKSLRKKKKV